MKKHVILFLAANPVGTTALRLDEETRAIQEELRRATQRDRFEFVARLAARPMDLLRALREVKPSIVHFAGHARADGIYLTSEHGQPKRVTRDALHATFGAAGLSVQIVVLNGCSTEDLAKALCELVPVCVGTSASIGDDAARVFSIGFYGALASSESAARACLHGKAAMHLEATGDHDQPRLHHRRDVDPDTLVLADEAAVTSAAPGKPIPDGPRPPPARAVAQQPTAVYPTVAVSASAVTRSAAGTDLIAPLVLLQLSDLHFGPHSRFAGNDLERLAAQCRQALDEARSDLGWRETVALVLVTGDIAEAARPPEYATAAGFFLALARELALSPHRFVFVPGNHDISWNKCREVEGQLDDGEFPASELRVRLDAVKFAHFEKFIRDVHGGKARHEVDGASVTSLAHGVFIHDFADLGVSVAALNSCERESHRKEDHVGALSADQAQVVLDHWRGTSSGLIRIAAVHHNPASMASSAIKQWLAFLRTPEATACVTPELVERIATNFVGFEDHDELVRMVSDAHASLIFHGHHHTSTKHQSWTWQGRDDGGPGDTRILSAGSWGLSPESGKLPKDQPVVMQLIRLDPAVAQLHAVLLTYDPNAHLPGEVRAGRFLLDSQARADRPIGLSLPPVMRGRFRSEIVGDSAPGVSADSRSQPRASEVARVLAAYRARKSGSFERWDLRTAGPTPTTGNRPAEITLDEMYIPLRFIAELDPSRFDRGMPISPGDLLRPRQPRVVIGGAGSGKTTWMRWTFRRLIRNPRAVPFFLELRAIASAWRTFQDAGRSVDGYLAGELISCGASDPGAIVAALLADPSGPQPVILIDGWDELGAQGERLRERLVEFCRAFPRVVVVVSSRPYGGTRPSSAEAFNTLHIQPLSDDDVRLLATRFHREIHGLDDAAGPRATDAFMAALTATPDARSLAGTALLLTMMLLLSREGPLPDRRHKLYTACLRNMLLHRVDQRERDGVVVDLDQWRPDDSEERLRVVAELAYRMQTEGYRMQTEGYKESRRTPMIRAWDAAVELLKAEWTRDQRDRFLRWLVATAGILIDRTDGSVQFAHLSFQEHLAAYYLFIAREGEARIAAVRSHMGDRGWWETLRLWAGLTGDKWPDNLSPVLDVLRANIDTFWLVGQIFADGTGRQSDFDAWAAELPARLSDLSISGEDCASAWGACKQSDRRAVLTTRLASVRGSLHWLGSTWHAHWCRLANLAVKPAPALLALEAPIGSGGAAARSRTLLGRAAGWPDGGELAMLRLWPSARGKASVSLQTAIGLGAQASEIVAMLPALQARITRSWSGEDHALAEDLSRYFGRYFGRYYGRTVGRGLGRYFGRVIGRYLGQVLALDFDRDLVRDFGRNFAPEIGRYFVRDFDGDLSADPDFSADISRAFDRGFGRDLGRDFVRRFVRRFVQYLNRDIVHVIGRDIDSYFVRVFTCVEPMTSAPWLPAFAFVEAGSVVGRAAPRAALAHGEVPDGVPLLALFRVACRASFTPDDAILRTAAARACDTFDGDPLWPALARHVARISTAEDRTLLEDLARHPEKREPPLSWGLQHYVRGDLVFADDSVVTLDELCAQAGLAPLPLLEPMPDELDIPLDDAPP